jgi:biopolymer transport protein ExbD
MAILNQKKSKVSDEIPTSSMADIAFLLLIFFLVTTVFPKDKGLSVVLPEEGVTAAVSQKNILHLIIQPNCMVRVKHGEAAQEQIEQPADVQGVWRQTVADNPNLIAAVKTDPNAPYKCMMAVLDALKLANADRISLQMLGEK